MANLKDTPLRIPERWSPSWFRQFLVEVIAPADVRNAIGGGLSITSDGNSVATLSMTQGVGESIECHNSDPFAHGNMIAAHVSERHPHASYTPAGDTESLAFFLGE